MLTGDGAQPFTCFTFLFVENICVTATTSTPSALPWQATAVSSQLLQILRSHSALRYTCKQIGSVIEHTHPSGTSLKTEIHDVSERKTVSYSLPPVYADRPSTMV